MIVHRSGMSLGQAYSAMGGFPCGCVLALVCAAYCLAAGPVGWLVGLFVVPIAFFAGALAGAVLIWVVPFAALIWLLNASTGTPQPELFRQIARLVSY